MGSGGGERYSTTHTPRCSPSCPKDLLQRWRCAWGCPFHRGRSGAGGGPGPPSLPPTGKCRMLGEKPPWPSGVYLESGRPAPAHAEERACLSGGILRPLCPATFSPLQASLALTSPSLAGSLAGSAFQVLPPFLGSYLTPGFAPEGTGSQRGVSESRPAWGPLPLMHKPMPRILAFPGPGYALPKTEMQPSHTMGSKGSSPTLILIPVMEELPFQVARKEGRLRKSSRLSTMQPVEHKARAVVLKGESSEFTCAPSTGLLWSPSFRKWVPALPR